MKEKTKYADKPMGKVKVISDILQKIFIQSYVYEKYGRGMEDYLLLKAVFNCLQALFAHKGANHGNIYPCIPMMCGVLSSH